MCASPFYFNKVIRPVIVYFRSTCIGLRVTVFVDDFLLASSISSATDHAEQLIQTLTELGFTINFEKSQLFPSQYIGYSIHSTADKVRVKALSVRTSKLKRSRNLYVKHYSSRSSHLGF